MFLIADTSVRYIEDDVVELSKDIPAGIYKTTFSQFIGTYLEKAEYSTKHGKIYGKSQSIADHIIKSYKMDKSGHNMGVLFSGGKGLGKSLTTRLIVEQLTDYPIILVNDYTQDLISFLSHIKNSVIIFDEFEKTMAGNIDGSDNHTECETKQESFLSLLDGSQADAHNLYILTCNDQFKINENMLSRPGRIKYHYRYESVDEDAINKYCDDNLSNKNLQKSIVESLMSTRYVSIDIVAALVEELNTFPEVSVDDALGYLNIECEKVSIKGCITFRYNGKIIKFEDDMGNVSHSWTQHTYCWEGYENNDDNNSHYFCFDIVTDYSKFNIPRIGKIDILPYSRIRNSHGDNIELISYEIQDVEAMEFLTKTF